MRRWRPLGLAAAGLGLICVAVWPGRSPIASDVILTNIDDRHIVLSVPEGAAAGQDASAYLEAENIDHDMPIIAAVAATQSATAAAPMDLDVLVDSVVAMQGPELTGDLLCLASAIYYEARGESLEGQLAVAQVVLNRAGNSRWPRELCKVIYQRGQFSFTFDGRPDVPAARNPHWRRAEAVAVIAAAEAWGDITDSALFFHAHYVKPHWRQTRQQTRQIGRHIFYR